MKIEDIIRVINGTMPNYHITSTDIVGINKKRVYVKGRQDRFSLFSIYTYGNGNIGEDYIWYVNINKLNNVESYEIRIPDNNIEEFFLLLDSYLMENKEIKSSIAENSRLFKSLIDKDELYQSNIRDLKISKLI